MEKKKVYHGNHGKFKKEIMVSFYNFYKTILSQGKC